MIDNLMSFRQHFLLIPLDMEHRFLIRGICHRTNHPAYPVKIIRRNFCCRIGHIFRSFLHLRIKRHHGIKGIGTIRNPFQYIGILSMLRAGVPVQHAYEVVHMDQIKAGVAAMQAKATEKQVVDGIRAKGARPQENGTTSQGAFIVKDDVSKLSKRDRAEIIRRAARGEHIEF